MCLVSGNHSGRGVPPHVLHRQRWRALAGRPLRVHPHEIWLEHHLICLNYQKFLWAEDQSQIDLLILSLLPLRCFWRLHLPHHCSSDASLHRLQQKEGGGCLEAPSGMMRPMMWLCLAEFCVSLTANPHVSNQHPAALSTERLDASDARWKELLRHLKELSLFIIRISFY